MQEPAQVQTILLSLILLMLIVGIVPLAIFAWWMWSFGSRVAAEGRFPPSDALRWKNSTILTGDAARSRALLFRVFAVVFGLLACGLTWSLWRLWVVFR